MHSEAYSKGMLLMASGRIGVLIVWSETSAVAGLSRTSSRTFRASPSVMSSWLGWLRAGPGSRPHP